MNKETVVSIILIAFLSQFFPAPAMARTHGHYEIKPAIEFCTASSMQNCPVKIGAKHCPLMNKLSYHNAKAPLHPNNDGENKKPHCGQTIKCAGDGPSNQISSGTKDMPCLTGTFSLDHRPAAEGRAPVKTSLYKQPFNPRPERPPSNT